MISGRDEGREKVDFEAKRDCIIDMHNGSFLETVEFKTTTGRDLQKLLLFKKLIIYKTLHRCGLQRMKNESQNTRRKWRK